MATTSTPSTLAVTATSPDDDVAQAVVTKWNLDPNLMPQLVPGGLEQDRVTPTQPNAEAPQTVVVPAPPRAMPWATFKVDKFQDPDLSTGGRAIDHRLVTIEIRGLKPDAAKALSAARGLFIQKVLLMPAAQFPNVVGGMAMAVLEVGADDLHKDETVRAGEDIWVGALAMHVMTDRRYV